jgi:hypothetical protein
MARLAGGVCTTLEEWRLAERSHVSASAEASACIWNESSVNRQRDADAPVSSGTNVRRAILPDASSRRAGRHCPVAGRRPFFPAAVCPGVGQLGPLVGQFLPPGDPDAARISVMCWRPGSIPKKASRGDRSKPVGRRAAPQAKAIPLRPLAGKEDGAGLVMHAHSRFWNWLDFDPFALTVLAIGIGIVSALTMSI